MIEVDGSYRPHGDEWRWRLRPVRSVPSISVIVAPGAGEAGGPRRAFGFARELADEVVEPLVWEGD